METAGEDAGGGGGEGLGPGEVTCQAIPHQHTPYMPLERKINMRGKKVGQVMGVTAFILRGNCVT